MTLVAGSDTFTANTTYQQTHLVHNDYYEKGKTIDGHWRGQACELYGVEQGAVVDSDDFVRLRDNRQVETGDQISVKQVENRKPFADFTIGAPKTWSLAAVNGRADLMREGHRYAADKVMTEMESWCGRQAHDGKQHVERTGNFCAAVYEHDTNRSLEAHLHTHVVIFNLTRAANGKDYAQEYRELMDRSKYLTQVYNNALAAWALDHGADVTFDPYGAPQLTALLDLKELSQQRTQQIEALVDRVEEIAGTRLTNREAKSIALASRGLDLKKFESVWEQKRGMLQGLKTLDPDTAETARREILFQFTKAVWQASTSQLIKTTGQEVAEQQRSVFTVEQLDRIAGFKDTLSREPVRSREPARVDHDLDFAARHLFERNSVVKDYELYEQVLLHAKDREVELAGMKAAAADHRELVTAHHEVTTREHLTRECESILWVQDGKGGGVALSSEGIRPELNEHQREAIKSLLECPDQFSALDGAAGVGKSFSLADLIEKNLGAGCKVAVVAPSNAARDVIREYAHQLPDGYRGAAVLRDAVSLQKFQDTPSLHERLGRGDLLLIDEASFVSVEQGHEAMQWAIERGCRVLFSGDVKQLTAVEAGDHFRILLGGSGIHTARLDAPAIIRQDAEALEGRYREGVKLFNQGKTTEAFRKFHEAGRIRELQGAARVEAFAEAIEQAQDKGQTVIACNPTHRENDAVNDAVRARMGEKGKLFDERTLEVHRSLSWTQAQKREVKNIQPGQVLEIVKGADQGRAWTVEHVSKGKVSTINERGERRLFTRKHAELFDVCERRELKVAINDQLLTRSGTRSERGDIINGERLTVAGWDEQGNPVASDGREITGRNLAHAYASTAHKVQGATADKVLFGFDRHSIRGASRKLAYVMSSRGKVDVEVFVENIADLSQIQARTGDRKAATEMDLGSTPDLDSPAQKLFRKLQNIRVRGGEIQVNQPAEQTVEMARQVAPTPTREQIKGDHVTLEPDLQEPAIRTPDAPEPPIETEMNQTQKDRRLAEFETRLRQRAAEQYPEPTPEQTTRLEVKVSRAVEEYALKLSRQADERRQEAERAQAFDAYRSMQPQPSQEMDLER